VTEGIKGITCAARQGKKRNPSSVAWGKGRYFVGGKKTVKISEQKKEVSLEEVRKRGGENGKIRRTSRNRTPERPDGSN